MSGSVVVLYSESGSRDCNLTRQALRTAGIAFEEINARKDAEAWEFVTGELGYDTLPVVWVDRQLHWSGHSAAQIERLKHELG